MEERLVEKCANFLISRLLCHVDVFLGFQPQNFMSNYVIHRRFEVTLVENPRDMIAKICESNCSCMKVIEVRSCIAHTRLTAAEPCIPISRPVSTLTG